MADVQSVDYLSLKITQSTGDAVKALNDLESALVGVISATGSLKEAAQNVADFGRKLNSMSKNIRDVINASKEITFGGAEAEARELDKVVGRLSKETLSTFGVSGKKAASEYRQAFSDLVRQARDTDGLAVDRPFKKAQEVIENNTRLLDYSKEDYIAFAKEIDNMAKTGRQVHISFKYDDLGAGKDVDDARRVFSKIFTKSRATVDFEEWASELADQFRGVIALGDDTAETIENIVRAYDEGKNAYMDYQTAIQTPELAGGTEGFKSTDAIVKDLDRALRKVDEIKKRAVYGDSENNAFNTIAESISALDGVNIPNMDGLSSLAETIDAIDPQKMLDVGNALDGLGRGVKNLSFTENGSAITEFFDQIAPALQRLQTLTLPDFSPLVALQSALKGFGEESYTIAATNMEAMTPIIEDFAKNLENLPKVDVESLVAFINAIKQLGGAGINKAIENMPILSEAFEKLIDRLNALPEVKDKTLRLVEAISSLKSQSISLGSGLTNADKSLNSFGETAHNAKARTNGLVSVFVKARAVIYALRQAFNALKESISLSSDLTEVQNVVDVTFGNYASKIDDVSKNAIESYGISELTFKTIASQFQAMGSAMGIGSAQIKGVTQNLNEMGIAYGEATGAMGDMSTTLTELAADMASFYNKDVEDVQTALTAVYTGQTRPLRQFGIDLTQATLKEWALANGLNANVESMTQAEKTMLRYQYVLAHTTAAQGDFTRTASTWRNQVAILKEEFKALGVVVGSGLINAFKPFVSALNATLKSVIGFAQNVVNALGQIFGWTMEITGGGLASDYLDDIADEAASIGDGLSDGVGDAADSAKALKDILLGIDELNILNDNSGTSGSGNSGSGSGSGTSTASGGLGTNSNISATLKRTKAFYESDIDTLFGLGDYISKTLRNTLASIDWESIYGQARDFGKGLASFLNGLIRPDTFGEIGGTIAGALNTAITAAVAFGKEFDAENFGAALAEGINRLFGDFNFIALADLFTDFAGNLWGTLIGFITNVDLSTMARSIATFFERIVINAFSGISKELAKWLEKLVEWEWLPDGAKGALNDVINHLENFADDCDEANKLLEKEAKKTNKAISADATSTLDNIQRTTAATYDANAKAVHDYRQRTNREMLGLNSDLSQNPLKITTSYPNVTADMQARMNELKAYWNANKKLPNLEAFHNDFYGNFKATVNDLQNWFNQHRNLGKIVVETPTVQSVIQGGANAGTMYFKTTYTPMAYASGGYPNIGELFYAGEHGIAEIAGQINGRTAVAGGAEITGIKKAIEAETALMSTLMNNLIGLNRQIAAKNTTVTLNGRTLNREINRQTVRSGYSFT